MLSLPGVKVTKSSFPSIQLQLPTSLVHVNRTPNLHTTNLLKDICDPGIDRSTCFAIGWKDNRLECRRERRHLLGVATAQLQEPAQSNLPPTRVVDILARGLDFPQLRLQDLDKLLVHDQEDLFLLAVHNRQCVLYSFHNLFCLCWWRGYCCKIKTHMII